MATTYDQIYDRFLSKITDYELSELDEQTLKIELKKYLIGAISEFKYCTKNLSDRNDEAETFNIDLTDLEQEILAKYMVVKWLEPKILHEYNLRNIISSKDYTIYSPANLLDKLTKLKLEVLMDVNNDVIYYFYSNIPKTT